MPPATPRPPARNWTLRNWPLWWFSQLDTAVERGNRRAALEALQNLARLGIEVRFTLPPCQAAAGGEVRHGA
jgi:hypothetical protein